MALLQLPPELLLCILGHLGFPFFAQDVRRLAVSKQWYDLAWPVFVQDLQLTTRSLVRFTDDDAAAARSAPHMATVKLRVHKDIFDHMLRAGSDLHDVDYPADAACFNTALTKLAATLRRCPRMRSLDMEMRLGAALDYRAHLMAEPLAGLLSAARLLTSLTFDSATCLFQWTPDSGVHFCHVINALLPSLRRLRCRMQTVCKTLLEPPLGDTPLALEEVIVNLSLSQMDLASTSYAYSSRCGDVGRTAVVEFRDAMKAQATALAARLHQPRMVRIITHEVPSLDIYAFDALTGKQFRLENNIEWDAEGKAEDDAEADASDDDERDLFADEPPVTPFIVL